MKKPFVFYPSTNHGNTGENHRTVTIKHLGQTVRIQCDTRKQAEELGRGLVGVMNRYLTHEKATP